jgi:uncharacterized membrane protein YkoI
MNNREIEKRIHTAVCSATPDKLDDIMKACGIENREELSNDRNLAYIKPKKKRPLYKVIGSVAAAIVICVAGIMVFGSGATSDAVAIIGLDVNPSIQISVDDEGRVIEASAVNKDGEQILDGMSLAGTDMKVAANAIVGSMLQQGYLNDISNSILVSVQAKDSDRGTSLQEELSSSLNQYLASYALSAAVMGQCITDDREIADFAAQNGISEGKAWLIKNLAAADSRLTEAGLLKLSTQELVLLASEKSSDKTPSVAYGEVNKSQYIGKDKALKIALAKAGLNKSQISDYRVEFECDDGVITYDVEFYSGSTEYEFEIDATTGNIIEYETDGDGYSGDGNGRDSGSSSYIGRSKAKETALAKAGLSASQIRDYEIELDDGEYEIEFRYQNMEYEVDIDAATGKILKFNKEYDD